MLQWHTKSTFFYLYLSWMFSKHSGVSGCFSFVTEARGSGCSQITGELDASKQQPEAMQGVSECLVKVCIVQFSDYLSSFICFI